MHKIRLKILLITLLPSMLILGLLSFYLLQTRSTDLEQNFEARGRAIARQLATAAVTGVLGHDRDLLELLGQATLRNNPHIQRIRFLDAHGLRLAEVSRSGLRSDNRFPQHFSSSVIPSPRERDIYQMNNNQLLLHDPHGNGLAGEVHVWISPSDLALQRHHMVVNTILLSLAGLLTIALLSVFLSQRIARPLEELTRAARSLRKGRLETRVPIDEQGEIGELQKAFNEMAQEIAIANETLQARVEQATRDLQESMEVLEIKNVELDLARRKALQAYQAKSEFLASMSHEIRTPMNGVLGFTNLLRKTPLNKVQQEYLGTIENSARSLLTIINDILDLSRLEAGKLNLERNPFSLRQCVDDTISLLAPMAQEKRLELVSFVYDDVPDDLVGDRTRIAQIITNLVNNAIKFTDEGEVILRVMLEEEDERELELAIQVTDTGRGIEAEDQERIFQTFVQGQTPGSTTGSGLGLSICQKLAQAMHGRISLHSTPGKGSTFTCHLRLGVRPPRQAAEAPFRGRRVRLLEAHPASRQALTGVLETLGVAVSAPETDLRLRGLERPEDEAALVLCLNHRQLKSRHLMARVRRRLAQVEPPVLVLVGSASQRVMDKLLHLGARQCLSKPVRRSALEQALAFLFSDAHRPATRKAAEDGQPRDEPVGESRWLKGKRILVADDNAVNRQLMQILLTNLGASVVCVENGRQAVEVAEEEELDLVVMDIYMPEMNGLQAARAIHALPGRARLPMVAMTADAMSRNRRQIARSDFQAYLIKPIDERELMMVLHDFFFSNRLRRSGTSRQEVRPSPSPPERERDSLLRDEAQALRIAGGSSTIADTLLQQFLEHLDEDVAEITALVNDRQWEEAWQAVHRLKGAVTVCAVPAFEIALKRLQTVVQERLEEAVPSALAALEREQRRLQALRQQDAVAPPAP